MNLTQAGGYGLSSLSGHALLSPADQVSFSTKLVRWCRAGMGLARKNARQLV
jgi:hypothetical protein